MRRVVALLLTALALSGCAGPRGLLGATPQPVVVSGTVSSAAAVPLAGALVEVQDPAGAVLAQAVTDGAGQYRLQTPPGELRIVIGSGSYVGSAASLPDRFSWSGRLDVTSDLALPITLPAARQVTVVATDGSGRPLAGARVGGPEAVQVARAVLWPGGPDLAGSQVVRPEPATTDGSGRAVLWSFPTRHFSAYVERDPALGTVARTDVSVAVTGDTTVAAMPDHGACTRAVTDLGPGPVRLVSDLDQVTVRDSGSRPALLRRADQIVDGRIPDVAYNSARTGDPKRYLYDEGVALRRITGILAYAYAVRHDPRYLDAMASKVAANAAAWPDWNPGHPLDTVQVATAVSLAYGWSASRMAPEQRAVIADALVTRMVLPYSCGDGAMSPSPAATGNQNTVIASAAVLAGLAVRNDVSAWGSAAVEDGAAALGRVRLPDGRGRSLASGPTVEGLMYTTYEAASLALVHATARLDAADEAVGSALRGRLADLDVLAAWTENCGTLADPAVEDGWDFYPWVDRPTALAAMAASPSAGSRVLEVLDALQDRDTLTIPGHGSWAAPDGIAELLVSGLTPRAEAAPAAQSYAPVGGAEGSYWGCASDGSMRALVTATPNDAAHAHRDVGNLVVTHGSRTVLADLGQRDYNFSAPYPWRGLTKAHSTVGVLEPDGRVIQADDGWGSVSATRGGLQMVTATALAGIDWRRDVAVAESSVTVRDQLQQRDPGRPAPLSVSFLLGTGTENVTDLGGGRVRFLLGDGSTWELAAPHGVSVEVTDARPSPPYADTKEFGRTLGVRHTLVILTPTLDDRLDLTTTLTRTGP